MIRVNGRLQRRTIGRYPMVSLSEARAATLEMQRVASEGVDPRQPKASAQRQVTFKQLVDKYYALHLEPNTRSGADIRGSLLHPRLRHFLTRQASSICKAEIIQVLDELVEAGTPQAAVNILRRLRMLFNWAVDRELLPSNPTQRIRQPAKTVERDRVLSDEEIGALWRATWELPTPYGEMYRMFFLTGQRRCEVSTMRWEDINGSLWIIPRGKVKKDRAHAVPLSNTAEENLASLRNLPRIIENGFVFTTTGGVSASSNFHKVKRQLDLLSGVSGWTIHDIRRTVRSQLAELGVAREVARKVLNHEDGKVDRIYNRHEYLAEKRQALALLEGRINRLASSAEAVVR